jgi:hypothetical protein
MILRPAAEVALVECITAMRELTPRERRQCCSLLASTTVHHHAVADDGIFNTEAALIMARCNLGLLIADAVRDLDEMFAQTRFPGERRSPAPVNDNAGDPAA